MELEFKHIAPYLPYGLKVQVAGEWIDDEESNGPRIWDVVGIADGEIITHKEGYIANIENEIEDCFPILRPLSDLTDSEVKILFRHKAESGVTVERYCSDLAKEITITATYKMMGDAFTDFVICRNTVDNVDYWIVEILVSNHFDVFGLIEAGLAIDINTIET